MTSKAPVSILQQYLKYVKEGRGFDTLLKTVHIISAKDGKCTAEFTVTQDNANFNGYLHGGFSAFLVDTLSGLALVSKKREAVGVSVNINLSYLKAAKIGEQVVVEARTIKEGKNLGFLEVELKNKQTGDIYVIGSHTKYIG